MAKVLSAETSDQQRKTNGKFLGLHSDTNVTV